MAKSKRRSNGQHGCGFMILSGLALIALLSLNMAFVRLFFSINLTNVDERAFQAAQFVLPILMIAIEFWIYDQVFNRRKMPKRDDDTK
jgi:hypothetical protein